MKQRTKRLMSLMLTMSLTAGCMAVPVAAEEAAPSEGAKYTTTMTEDGWIKIENEGGETLGMSAVSGVRIVEDDGFAFKDLNQNRELDAYEDWRLPTEERTENLVNQMQGKEIAAVLTHGGWGEFTTEQLTEENTSYTYLKSGGRGGVSRTFYTESGSANAKWANAIQSVAESCFYGIPAMISTDPATYASGTPRSSEMIETVSLAATMNPELAAEIGVRTSRQHRAAGVCALLGPQVDVASPVMGRAGGTYGEDPQLTRDIATAYVNAMQSTYDENGEDLGWGEESVFCFTKHYGGAGASEGGRDDHHNIGRYAAFPGNNLEAHLITYYDGVFNLPGNTKSSGIMTQYAINVDAEGNPFGGELGSAYNPYMNNMLTEAGFDGLRITDWGSFENRGMWGLEELTEPERIALGLESGINLLGGYNKIENVLAGYDILVERHGQEEADAIMRNAVHRFIRTMMDLNMFDQPYCDSAYAESVVRNIDAIEYGTGTRRQSIVMLKNDGTIGAKEATGEKPTVYIPYAYDSGFDPSWIMGVSQGPITWKPSMNLELLEKYFNVVTDTLGAPTGEPDANGNPTYTMEDLTRATAEEVAACDYVLVGMKAPYMLSYNKNMLGLRALMQGESAPEGEDEWYPVSLQYGEYTADTAREVSLTGLPLADGTRENRSYKGNTSHECSNIGDLKALQYANEVAGEIPVIVSMVTERGMVWSEVEPLADVIFVNGSMQNDVVIAEMILGQYEPSGLLPFQQPASMEAVEAQLEDVPRDMECYVDAAGNAYDFTFGLNWSGVISDERTEKYSAEPITKIQSFDYSAYEAANK